MQLPATHEFHLESAAARPTNRARLAALLLALATLAVFWPVTRCQFINLDDPLYVTANSHVQRGLTADGAAWAFRAGEASNWHPLTWLSHMLDREWFGAGPAGPHFVNLLFHAANTVVLLLLLNELTAALWRSVFVAALFALHPLHVESVAWISERKDVLSTLFWLLSLLAYARYAREGTRQQAEGRSPASSGAYWLALIFFALGLMSKPMLVTLPLTLLLLDYWPLNRVPGAGCRVSGERQGACGLTPRASRLARLLLEKWPFFLLSLASCVVTFLVQRSAGAVSSLQGLSAGARVGNALVAYARYLGKMFWPVDLAIPYPHPGHWPAIQVLGAAVLIAGLTAAALWLGRKQPCVISGWLWFLVTLLPVIGLVQVGHQSLADRYTYVPLIGLFVVIAWGAGAAAERWHWPRPALAAIAVLVLAAGAARTRDQLRHWTDSGTLFRHALAVTEKNFVAHDNLGFYLFSRGDQAGALDHYREALRIRPNDPNTLNNLGSLFLARKQYAEAIRCYETALQAKPDFADAHLNLGAALFESGQPQEALPHYTAALRLAPDSAQAHNNLANLLVAQGKTDDAIARYRQALDLNPNLPEALNNLGWLLAAKGRFDEAIADYEKAVQLRPDDELFHKNFGDTLAAVGRTDAALEQYTAALRLMPNYAEGHCALGQLLKRLGRSDEAAAHFSEALRLKPDYPEARRALESLAPPGL